MAFDPSQGKQMTEHAHSRPASGFSQASVSWSESLALGGLIFVSAALALGTRPPGQLAPLWISNALLLGLMLRWPALSHRRGWGCCALGMALAEWLSGSALSQALWLTFANLAAVASGWLVMGRLPPHVLHMRSPTSVLHLVLCSLVASLVGSVLGAAGMQQLRNIPWPSTMALWFSNDLMHMTLILPVLLSLPDRGQISAWRRRAPECRRQDLLPLLVLLISEGLALAIGGPGALSLTVPALLLCAMRYELFFVAVLSLLSCGIKLAMLSQGAAATGAAGLDSSFSFRLGLALLPIGPLAVACAMHAFQDMLSKLHHAVSHDALTGLLSRASFMEHAQRSLERLARQQSPVAMLMLDLDYFKCINDHHGHAAGDCVLQEVTLRLSQALRPHELIGRLGGEEFAVLLPAADCAAACAVAQRLCETTREICIEMGPDSVIRPTMSIGIAWTSSQQPHSLSALLRLADVALYHAKDGGRNRFFVADVESSCSPAAQVRQAHVPAA